MRRETKDIIALASLLGGALYIAANNPKLLNALAASAKAAKERQQADDDLLGNAPLITPDREAGEGAQRHDDEGQAEVVGVGSSVLARLRERGALGVPMLPGSDGRLKARHDGSDNLLPIEMHGLCLVVRNTLWGRLWGRVRLSHRYLRNRFMNGSA